MITAKPIVADQFWILKKQNQKIGEVEADADGGYSIKIGTSVEKFNTLQSLATKANIVFDPAVPKVVKATPSKSVHGFPTNTIAYNPVFDVKNRLPMFTKKKNSKSWYAAGWYRIRQHDDWETVFCPKLILLHRYEHKGPVKDPEDFEFK